MMRTNRPSAATVPCKSHASCTPCGHQFWRLHEKCDACDLRATVAAHNGFDRIIAHGFRNRAQLR
eukprot:9011014-Lingulodinium_polyedra.AAC.1